MVAIKLLTFKMSFIQSCRCSSFPYVTLFKFVHLPSLQCHRPNFQFKRPHKFSLTLQIISTWPDFFIRFVVFFFVVMNDLTILFHFRFVGVCETSPHYSVFSLDKILIVRFIVCYEHELLGYFTM